MNCFTTASINIFNDSGNHCHSKKTRNYYTATLKLFPPMQIYPRPWATAGASAPPRAREAKGCSRLTGRRRMSQSCICNAGVVLDWCHEVKHRCPVSFINAVWQCQEKKCSLLTTCFNENALQYLKSFQSWLLLLTADRFMTAIFDEKCATRMT